MNMFRNIICVFLVGVAIAFVVSNPAEWPIVQRGGPDLLNYFRTCVVFRPFVIGACIVTALALFMTRKQY